MESAMRQRLGKRVWKTILWLLLFSLAGTSFLGVFYQVFGRKSQNLIASVGGIGISSTDLFLKTEEIQELTRVIRSQAGEHADFILHYNGLLGNPKVLALDALVSEAVKTSGALNSGFKSISPIYGAERLNDQDFLLAHASQLLPMHLFRELGRIDEETLKIFFARSPQAAERFDAAYENVLRSDLFISTVRGLAYVPRQSILWQNKMSSCRRSFEIFDISKNIIKKNVAARMNDALIQSFFAQENKSRRYWKPEQRNGVAFIFSPEKYGITVSDVAARRYFAENASSEFKGKTFDSVKNNIQNRLIKDQFKRLFAIEARNFLSATAEGFLDYQTMKNAKKTTIKRVSNNAAKDRTEKSLFAVPSIGARSFFVDENGNGIIVELQDLIPSSEQDFNNVKTEVERDWIAQETQATMSKIIDSVLAGMPYSLDGESAKLLKQYQASSRVITGIQSSDKTQWEKLSTSGYPVESMQKMGHPGFATATISKDQEHAYIVVLKDVAFELNDQESLFINERNLLEIATEKDVLATLKESVTIKQYKDETDTTDFSKFLD